MNDDLISREALLKRVDEERKYLIARGQTGAEHILVHNFRDLIDNAPSPWIPVTYRPMTDEEEKEFCEKWDIKEGSLEDWEKRVFTCHLPDDGQEILTSFFGRYVKEDICSWDEYGCGLENNGDWDGVDAWMPKPEPYKKGGAE